MRELPELFDLRLQARSLAYLFIAGAALGLLTLVFPHSDQIRDLELVILAAVAILIAVVIWVFADRVRPWQLHVVLATGTIILSLANYYVEATVIYPVLYTWTALYAFYFFRLEIALAHIALIAVGYAVVLVLVEPSSAVVRWLLAVGTPLIAGLLISRLLGMLRVGVQDAERRTRALQESEARTRLVLDGAPDAFVALDRDGVITSWNTAAERLFGWSASEAIGVPLRSLVTPEEFRDRHDERRTALIETPQVVAMQRYDTDFVRRDGTRFPAEATVSKIEIKGEPFVSGFIRDVSERVRRQQERETLLREQAARAEAERVAELVSGMQLLVDAALAHRTLDDILEDLIMRVRGVLQADAATILLADEEERLTVAASSLPRPSQGEPGEQSEPLQVGEGFAGRVAQTREAMLAHDPEPADLPDPALGQLEIESLIGVPLLAENAVTGVLVVASVAPRRFSAEDLTLLRLAADRVALAIEHARVYEREHKIAVTLQESLLPAKMPDVPGLEVAARYLPAATEADVGGDWYDVIPTPTGGLGLVMGDVAGKGLAAASMVSRLRSALRAYALEGHEPARVIEQLNRLGLDRGARQPDGDAPLHGRRAGREPRRLGERRPPGSVARQRARRRALPGGPELGSAWRPSLPELRDRDVRDGAGQLARPVHRRPDRATGRADRRRHGAARRARERGARRPRGAVRPPAGDARAEQRRDRRRRDPDAPQPAGDGPLSRRVRGRAGGALADARDAAPLVAPRGRRRQRDRRDHDGLRRGSHERDRACGRRRRGAFRDQRPATGTARSRSPCAIAAAGATRARATRGAASRSCAH